MLVAGEGCKADAVRHPRLVEVRSHFVGRHSDRVEAVDYIVHAGLVGHCSRAVEARGSHLGLGRSLVHVEDGVSAAGHVTADGLGTEASRAQRALVDYAPDDQN